MVSVLVSLLAAPVQAPLTTAQVNKKLNVPIFLAMNNLGRPMMAAQEGRPVVLVFFRKSDCDAAIKGAADSAAKSARAAVGTLSDIQAIRGATPFYVPIASEQEKALEVGKLKALVTTAVFYVATKSGSQVTVQVDGKTVAPFCFDWDDAEKIRQDAVESKKVTEPVIKMTTLSQLIEMLRTKPAAEAERITLVEHRSARQDVKDMTGGG
ncbi:MAG: hypothetical protein ABL949_07165 [Fimbriimonadaceae bacterium]